MDIFESWPYNWFGLWKSSEADPFDVPIFTEVVDPTWLPSDLANLAAYLRTCPVSITSGAQPALCPLCGHTLTELSAQRSDGVWVWPSSLSHYVEAHHVRLPNRMVEHIRARNYQPAVLDQAGQPSTAQGVSRRGT